MTREIDANRSVNGLGLKAEKISRKMKLESLRKRAGHVGPEILGTPIRPATQAQVDQPLRYDSPLT